jgi:drug/metabolite transporter (DMT)-like permease
MRITKRNKALAAIIACVLLWGFSFISIKIAVQVFPPMTLGAIRFAIAIILLFFIKKKLAPEEKIRKEDLFLLTGAGLTGVTLYFFFENTGIYMIPASEASIIMGSVPVLTLIAEGVKEKIASRNIEKKNPRIKTAITALGALTSMSGVALVAGVSLVLSGTALGYVYMFGAAISWVCYCFFSYPLFARRSRIYIVFWQSVIGFVGFLPFVIFEPRWEMPGFYVWGHVVF